MRILDIYRGAVQGLASTRAGARLFRHVLPSLDRVAVRLTRGRFTVTGTVLPTLMLTTTGRTSGLPRAQPLCYLRDGADLLVVGTNWGQAHHPAWTANLLAEPHATVLLDGTERPVGAELVEGPERTALYRRFEALAPNYRAYAGRTEGRVPRVFRLVPG